VCPTFLRPSPEYRRQSNEPVLYDFDQPGGAPFTKVDSKPSVRYVVFAVEKAGSNNKNTVILRTVSPLLPNSFSASSLNYVQKPPNTFFEAYSYYYNGSIADLKQNNAGNFIFFVCLFRN